VLGKRSDGYHEIASVLQTINLYDRLTFSKASIDSLSCSDASLSCGAENLVVKALQLFRSRFDLSFGVRVHLEKKIPMQAGLGGGSSNAATTLWALNEMAGRPASLEELIEMGALLGSDVPFFFSEGIARCSGRGEIVEPVQFREGLSGWICKPTFGLSTALVYKETRVEEQRPSHAEFYNDLEPAAFRLEPRLIEIQESLRKRGFETVSMTGSGTAFFCLGRASHVDDLIPFRSVERNQGSWYASN
jgi:4-diphosphocytidyl-2-C-methyl-D-erythritol kinase